MTESFVLFRCMIRRLKSEVLTQLPAKRRHMIVLDPSMVNTKTKDMKEKAREMQKKSLSKDERRFA